MAYLDPLMARTRNVLSAIRANNKNRKRASEACRVSDYRLALRKESGRALLIYFAEPLREFNYGRQPNYFNPGGAVVEIATALNECGLLVDAVGINDTGFRLARRYSLVVAHAGPLYSLIGQQLDPSCRVIDYSTGCHWKAFNSQSERRYKEFAQRNSLPVVPPVLRPLVLEHEDYAASRADLVVCLGKETARTFEPHARRVLAVNNSAFTKGIRPRSDASERCLRSFFYNGGTGNVQKGVDLLIEAFAAEPKFHLYLDTPLEPEILAVYGSELRKGNIHYCEWSARMRGGFQRLIDKCAFVIHAGLNSGQSTSLVASLAWGLVPVVTRESNLGMGSLEVHIEAATVDGIRRAVRNAAALSPAQVAEMSRAVVGEFHEKFSPQAYRDGFRHAIESVLS